jgi:hypothetical protein
MADSKGGHKYNTVTWYKHLVAEYTGLTFFQINQLNYIEYLTYRRDAFITMLNKTEAGQEYLRNCWRMEQTEPDREALRRKFGRKEAANSGQQ